MTPTNRLAIWLLATVATCGYDRQTPTTPTAPITFAAAPQLEALHVVGLVVDSANSPVAGARVTRWDSGTETTITDAHGAF